MTPYSLDHIIFMVDDPSAWTRRLAAHGINAVLRDEGPGSDKHMLAVFEGCSYVEVIRRPPRPEDAHLPWEGRLSTLGEGFGGFCISVPDAEAAVAALYPDRPVETGAFGNTVHGRGNWRVRHGAPADHQDVTTPFLLESVEGREIRAPMTDAMPHASGLTTLAGIALAVTDVAAFETVYARLFPIEDAPALDWSRGDGRLARIGEQWVAAYVPAQGSAAAATIAHRGPGPVEIVLATHQVAPGTGSLLADLAPLAIRVA